MLLFYLKNLFKLNKFVLIKKTLHFSNNTNFFYYPRKAFKNLFFSFFYIKNILNNFHKNQKLSRLKILYGYSKKKKFILLCRNNFFRFFFYGTAHKHFSRLVKGMKPYNYRLLNIFFFNSIFNIVNFIFSSNYYFLISIINRIVFTVNGVKLYEKWFNFSFFDLFSIYWSNFFFFNKFFKKKKKFIYKKNYKNNNYSLIPVVSEYNVMFDFRQNIGFYISHRFNCSTKNNFNFNSFSVYNWRFIN